MLPIRRVTVRMKVGLEADEQSQTEVGADFGSDPTNRKLRLQTSPDCASVELAIVVH